MNTNLLTRRQNHSAISECIDIQQFFADAMRIHNASVRAQVLDVLMSGLDNADDSAYDTYGELERLEFGSRTKFWNHMFVTTCQSVSTERGAVTNGHARRWLARRGLMG